MTNAEKYFFEQMQDSEFRESFFQKKLKLDIEYQLDDLKEKINSGSSKTTLIRGLNQIKKTLSAA